MIFKVRSQIYQFHYHRPDYYKRMIDNDTFELKRSVIFLVTMKSLQHLSLKYRLVLILRIVSKTPVGNLFRCFVLMEVT